MKKVLVIPFIFAFYSLFAQSPSNDSCSVAQPVTIPSSGNTCITSSSAGATSDGSTHTCDTGTPGNEVWFTYIATGAINTITAKPVGASAATDLVVTLSSSPCSSGVFEACNAATGAGTATVSTGLTAGTQVWVSVETNGADGMFELCISSVTPPPAPGNACNTATLLCNKNDISYPTLTGYTASGIQPQCFGAAVKNDTWVKFTVGITGTLEFSATPNGEAEFDWAMFDITTGCPPNGNTNLVACNYNTASSLFGCNLLGASTGLSSTPNNFACPGEFGAPITVTAGKTYAIVIDNFSNNGVGFDLNWEGTFQIAPSANFTATPLVGCGSPFTVNITNNSVGASSYDWNFGDGTSSTASNPGSHTYTEPGNYFISLVTNSSGCTNVASQTVTLNIPNVSVSESISICIGESTDLQATASPFPPTYPLTFTNTTDVSIPNNSAAGVNSTISVSGLNNPLPAGAITSVCVNALHNNNADLDIKLLGPNGTSMDLSTDNGGTGNDYNNVCFITGGTTLPTGNTNLSGNYAPEGSFAVFNGINPNGNWTLNIADDASANSGGSLLDWTINFTVNNSIVSYQWNPATGLSSTNTAATTANPVTTTTYTVTVTDFKGCTNSDQVTVTVITTPEPVSVDAARCGSGTVDLSVTGCSGIVNWYAAATGGTPIASGATFTTPSLITSTTYFATCTDNGCESERTPVVATINPLPALTAAANPVNCFGSCIGGSLTANNATGGTSPYTYNWSGGLGNGQNKSDVCPGTYTVTVTDVNLCTSTATATVSEPQELIVTATSTDAICNGVCDGVVTAANATGGNSGYSYSWSSLGSGQSFSTACEGSYTVTVTDSKSCTATASVAVNEPAPLIGNITSTTSTTCGQANGAFSAEAAGGTAPYQFSLDNVTFNPSGNFSGLSAGSYNVFIKDSKGCEGSVSVTINDLSGLEGSVSSQSNVSCNGLSDGGLSVTSSGGLLPHQYAIDGGAFGVNTTFTNLAAGSHTVVVKDGNGCTVNISANITQPPTITSSVVSVTEATCGLNNGAFTVSATGGTNPLQYSVDAVNYQASGSFGNLLAGAYTVTIKDANNCEINQAVTVTQPSTLSTMIVNQSDASCYGYSDGSVTLGGSGGTIPYSYSSDNISFSSSALFENLSSGNYTFYVKDATGCAISQAVIINQPARVSVSVDPPFAEVCVGNQVTLTASGASTYSWSPGAGLNQTTGTTVSSNPVSTTTFTVTGTSSTGCIGDTTVTVTVNQLPVVSISPSNPMICVGSCISLTASGAPSIQWTPANNINPGTNFSTVSVCPASTITYTAFGTSSSGCVGSQEVTVTVVDIPVITVTPSASAICSGQSTGLQASGAVTYEWSVAGNPVATGASFTANPSVTTTYNVTGTVSSGCTNYTTVTVTVNSLPNVTVSPASPAICEGDNVALSGNGAATYLWTSGGQQVGNTQNVTVSPSANTTYTLQGTNSNGCKNTATATVFVNPLPVISVNSAEICKGDNVDLTANGASTYIWSDPVGGTLSSNIGQTVTASPASDITYSLTGTDNNNCSGSTDITVTVNELPIITVSPSLPEICKGQSVSLTASGAAQFNWVPAVGLSANSEATVVATPVIIGNNTYTVTGNDQLGCSGSTTVTVRLNDLPAVDIALSDNDICYNQSVSMMADAPTATQYQWSSGLNGGLSGSLIQQSASATPDLLNSNNYVVTYKLIVTDLNGCKDSTAKSVLVNPLPQVYVSSSIDTACLSENVILSASGADSYSWSPSNDLNIDNAAVVTANPTLPGLNTYLVTGSTMAGCENTESISFFVDPLIVSLTVLGGDSICEGENRYLSALANGGRPPYFYSWFEQSTGTTTSIFPNDNSTTQVFPLQTDYYVVNVTDACNSPSHRDSAFIYVSPKPEPDFQTSPKCVPWSGSLKNMTDIGSASCLWEFGNESISQNWDGDVVYDKSGNYDVTLTVTSEYGCIGSIIKTMVINNVPKADFKFSPEIAKQYNPVVSFNSSASVSNIKTFLWDFAGLANDSLPASEYLTSFSFPDSGHFPVQLIVVDENGCVDTLEQIIVIEPDWGLYIPSAFTPNSSSGLNDVFAPKGYGIMEYELVIFNRWGNQVFSTGVISDPNGNNLPGWDGKNLTNENSAQIDVYVYMIKGKTILGDSFNKKGHVTLLK